MEYATTHYITKLPSAVLAASLMIMAALSLTIGVIIDAIKNQTRTMFELHINEFVRSNNTVSDEVEE